ncbi:MAG TPA: FkbM family methyltransferase [Pyrinomonadaceae bacterium]|nr:FkbM family methyltransferase [Pyrinomonadaceae bacterium]
MPFGSIKSVLPNRPVPMRIWRGPLRGGRAVMNPRNSLRKVFGLYEHELNAWLESALCLTSRVIDVGANDGYFTFGCAAAFRRLRKRSEIVAFEPKTEHFRTLSESLNSQPNGLVEFNLINSFVGADESVDSKTLDSIQGDRQDTLIKIDVEGAEEDVLAGASSWLRESNYFLIEVHKEHFLESIPRLFKSHGLTLDQIDQRPLKLLGREMRDEQNWWLVTRL